MMKKGRTFIGLYLCLVLTFFLKSPAHPHSGKTTLLSFLPDSSLSKEWIKQGQPQAYKGEDLFLYINGGAEIYHEYHFIQVVVQDYKSNNGNTLVVEIFEMQSPADAYGMFTFKSSLEGKSLEIGEQARLESYYLNFWKGKYLVTITGFNENKKTLDGLLDMAKATAFRINGSHHAEKPAIVDLLPKEDLILSSIKYYRGPLGLFNCYAFSERDVFNTKEGIRASYETGYDLYIIQYTEPKDSLKTYQEAKTSLQNNPRYNHFMAGNNMLHFRDRKNTGISIRPYKNYILIVVGASSHSSAEEVMNKLSSALPPIVQNDR